MPFWSRPRLSSQRTVLGRRNAGAASPAVTNGLPAAGAQTGWASPRAGHRSPAALNGESSYASAFARGSVPSGVSAGHALAAEGVRQNQDYRVADSHERTFTVTSNTPVVIESGRNTIIHGRTEVHLEVVRRENDEPLPVVTRVRLEGDPYVQQRFVRHSPEEDASPYFAALPGERSRRCMFLRLNDDMLVKIVIVYGESDKLIAMVAVESLDSDLRTYPNLTNSTVGKKQPCSAFSGVHAKTLTAKDLEKMASASGHDGNDDACPICFEEYAVGVDVLRMECLHIYHEMCLRAWLVAHNTCPVCRMELPVSRNPYSQEHLPSFQDTLRQDFSATFRSDSDVLRSARAPGERSGGPSFFDSRRTHSNGTTPLSDALRRAAACIRL
ncbi:putative E3 ubiquitin-protein ligase RHC1A [Porphyridium purpureum]|uniref:Putative E3 ubiquitin-protein ligase RHC1A n=1 Tax=Porphyridium purpureum TaxID=35688 RepID=A0A5J4YXZ8_PORPP|nr:putative E3 ubiquitin-protein ligase RHC1A [Porphyridium purpureum]|eukprot:POR9296..scf209_3